MNRLDSFQAIRPSQIKMIADGIVSMVNSFGSITKSCFCNDFMVGIFTFEDHTTAAVALEQIARPEAILSAIDNVLQKENDYIVKEFLKILFLAENPLLPSMCEKRARNQKQRLVRKERASTKGTKAERGYLHDLQQHNWYEDDEHNGPGNWDISYGLGDEDYDAGMRSYWDL